ncbi:Clu domain-containing protein [Balamuthia mandrillaris]
MPKRKRIYSAYGDEVVAEEEVEVEVEEEEVEQEHEELKATVKEAQQPQKEQLVVEVREKMNETVLMVVVEKDNRHHQFHSSTTTTTMTTTTTTSSTLRETEEEEEEETSPKRRRITQQHLEMRYEEEEEEEEETSSDGYASSSSSSSSTFRLVFSEEEEDEESSGRDLPTGYCEATELRTIVREQDGSMDTKPKQRDPTAPDYDAWNEEFQRYYDMPTETPEDRLKRAWKIFEVYERFLTVAKELSVTIISELGTQKKTISRSQAGGVGGGEKYCARGIFFKFVRDVFGIYGGEHWSMKAAGHEIKSMNALLECNIAELHLPLVVCVDYWGYRVFAETALPINNKTICYGSDNGGVIVYDTDEKMRELMMQAAEKLKLKEHVVAEGISNHPKRIFGPCDIEGHKGLDGLYYLVDMARLFPSEGPFVAIYGVFIPSDESQELQTVELSRLQRQKDEDLRRILSLSSSEDWVEEMHSDSLTTLFRQKLPADRVAIGRSSNHVLSVSASSSPSTPSVVLSSSSSSSSKLGLSLDGVEKEEGGSDESDEDMKKPPFNSRASCLVGRPIFGNVIAARGTKLQNFYYLLRPELVRQSPTPLSSDAFSNFGKNRREEHEAEILALTRKLREEVIPTFARWINQNPHKVVSGLHLPHLMHKHGINLRYLGRLYGLMKRERLKYNCVGFQMIARLLKNQLRAKLREKSVNSEAQYQRVIVNFFNMVFGEDKTSQDFWEKAMPIHLLLKFGPFGFHFEHQQHQQENETENISNTNYETNFKFILGKIPLFHMLQEYTGVKFTLSAEEIRERLRDNGSSLSSSSASAEANNETKNNFFRPFVVEELAEVVVLAKKVDTRSKILPYIRKCCPVKRAESPEEALEMQRKHRKLVRDVYGQESAEMAASTIRLADMYSRLGNRKKAFALIKDCLSSMMSLPEMAGEVMLGCFYLMALILERAEDFDKAEGIYALILQSMLELYDSVDDPKSASPFEVELRCKLAELLERKQRMGVASEEDVAVARAHRERLSILCAIFPGIEESSCAYLFLSSLLLCLLFSLPSLALSFARSLSLSFSPLWLWSDLSAKLYIVSQVVSFLNFKDLSGYQIPVDDMDLQALSSVIFSSSSNDGE